MKIHVVESIKFSVKQKARLELLGKVTWFEGVPNEKELFERVEGAEILVADWAPIDKVIPKMKVGIKLISLPFTGVSFLPLKEAANKGIKIANAPGYSTEAVAEFGIGLMISAVRKIFKYSKGEPKPEITSTLYGKTLVILGAGRIGTAVGNIARSLGMTVVFWKRGENLLKAIKQADVVYSALPLNSETKGLLGKKEFEAMRKGAYFVTTSHNQIYNHDALLAALNDNLDGAAIDLEGINEGDYKSEVYTCLKGHSKILLTPHIAWKTDYAIRRGYDILIENIAAFVSGKPTNIVN